MEIPYEYEAQLHRGEQAAFAGHFKDAAKWFERASELGDQPQHVMLLEKVHLMHRLDGDRSPAHADSIEGVTTNTTPIQQLNKALILMRVRARVENGKWLMQLYTHDPDAKWHENVIDEAFALLISSESVLISQGEFAEAKKVAQMRNDFGVAIEH